MNPPQLSEYHYHTIWTPELVEISVPLAGLARRTVAMLIDLLVFLPVTFGFFLLLIFLMPQFFGMLAGISMMLTMSLLTGLFMTFWCIYFGGLHALNNGQTLGKMLVGIRLVNRRVGRANAASCFVRALFDVLDIMLFAGSIGAYLILLTQQERRIPDLVAGTLVILDRETA